MLVLDPLFPSDLAPEEEVAGFKITEIFAPHSYQPDGLKTIKAVVYEAGQSHRVIKMRGPDGKTVYKLQQFGVFEGSPDWEEPDWLPVGTDLDMDPNKAVEDAGRMMREGGRPEIISRVPPKIDH